MPVRKSVFRPPRMLGLDELAIARTQPKSPDRTEMADEVGRIGKHQDEQPNQPQAPAAVGCRD